MMMGKTVFPEVSGRKITAARSWNYSISLECDNCYPLLSVENPWGKTNLSYINSLCNISNKIYAYVDLMTALKLGLILTQKWR